MNLYLYIKAAHVVAVIFFVGGLLVHDSIVSATAAYPQTSALAVLRKIDRYLTTPALFLTWVLGFCLALYGGWFTSIWLNVKLIFVVVLSALHGIQSGRLRRSIRDERAATIIPGARITIVISVLATVFFAVVKPV